MQLNSLHHRLPNVNKNNTITAYFSRSINCPWAHISAFYQTVVLMFFFWSFFSLILRSRSFDEPAGSCYVMDPQINDKIAKITSMSIVSANMTKNSVWPFSDLTFDPERPKINHVLPVPNDTRWTSLCQFIDFFFPPKLKQL